LQDIKLWNEIYYILIELLFLLDLCSRVNMKRVVVGNVSTSRRRQPAPTIPMQICGPTGNVIATIPEATPDSGAEATVAGMEVLRQLGLSEQDLSHCPFELVMAVIQIHNNLH
jgi:hypothetical protein